MDEILNIFFVIATIIIFTIIIAPLLYQRYQGGNKKSTKYSAYIRPHSPVIGPTKAKVIVTIFLDPACVNSKSAYCGIPDLINQYKGKIKVVIRYSDFFNTSMKTIAILEAAKLQKMQKKVRDIVFNTPSLWKDGHYSDLDLLYAELSKNGVNIKRLKQDMNKSKISSITIKEITDKAELKIQQTPTYFVNGNAIGSFGLHFLEDLIKHEIKLNYEEEEKNKK